MSTAPSRSPSCIGAALAAVAGTMYLMYYGVVNFSDGFVPGIKAFTARCSAASARFPAR
jgi:branched-subunit amino acid ABC-type transport system permease component